MNYFPFPSGMRILLLVSFSFLAGVVGGLFGTGGGILIVFLYSRLEKELADFDRKDIFAMTVMTVALMSVSSLVLYIRNGAVSLSDVGPTLLPAALGGILGAYLLEKIDPNLLNRIFAVLMVYAGANLLIR